MLTENQLIQKIQELKQIKPDKDWAVLCKRRILPESSSWQEQLSLKFLFNEFKRTLVFGNLPRLFLQPKPVLAVSITLILLVAGLVFYLDREPTEIAQQLPAELEQAKMIVIALEELQTEVNQATKELKKIQEPQRVLEARNVVVPTIEAARNIIVETERLEQDIGNKQDRILAVKTSIDELESALDEALAIQAKRLIQDLETKTLTETQKQVLEQAKTAYQKGDYNIALINAVFVTQLNIDN